MKAPILIPLMATGLLLGCSEANQTQHDQSKLQVAEQKQIIPAWVGGYYGTTPCMGCLSRCEDCLGMAVALELHENMTYTIKRESLSGHNEIETLTGPLRFNAQDQHKVELVNVTKRNLLYVDLEDRVLEIREDVTSKKYQMQSDFILVKSA
ncbi:copper resistance protein NlpE N-terminal domain-containing protein [Acinetobacter sp. UBA6720]|uniref:copper resistance protein NlpE N-terminal domain-containing protein n=1 Tax=Acinetobacter sp. UBA6720 TaxID=1945953 RepID=UPI0025C62EF1|nr:copper resistance protein NlpE N-terminal domain-containing protein [Acinetobacter sp. UBA6720]